MVRFAVSELVDEPGGEQVDVAGIVIVVITVACVDQALPFDSNADVFVERVTGAEAEQRFDLGVVVGNGSEVLPTLTVAFESAVAAIRPSFANRERSPSGSMPTALTFQPSISVLDLA